MRQAPDHLNCMEVYLSNQCNMACKNCCVALSRDRATVIRLGWERLKEAIDAFLSHEIVPFGGRKYIVFAGGETFIDYPLLLQAAEYCRKFPVPPKLITYTNGTLAKRSFVEALTSLDMTLIFSIDGFKEDNDIYRRYRGDSPRSAWETVTKNLRDIPKDRCATNTVLRPLSLERTVEAFDYFSHMGFKTIDFWPDYFHAWTAEDRGLLRDFAREFKDYYVHRTLKDKWTPFHVPMLHHALVNAGALSRGEVWWRDCFRLVLGADGNFSDCQGVMHYPPEGPGGPSGIGGEGPAVDWDKRRAFMDRADRVLRGTRAERGWQHVCPRLYVKIAERDGVPPEALLDPFYEVSEILLKGLLETARELQDHPAFVQEYVDKLPVPMPVSELLPAGT